MRRNVIETVLGGVVLAVAAVFLAFAYKSADLRKVQGYDVTANFNSITGLQSGADVRISGVKVGTVTGLTLDPTSYQAVVHLSVDNSVKLPKDTAAVIASESLLGGKFLSLEPGGDPDMIKPNGKIEFTQSTPGLEQLLGQVIFSLQSMSKSGDQANGQPSGGQQGQAPSQAPAQPPKL
ncbi:phospholipid/cholesterol/gamma-HCH transport system substrate-binding protein [Azospirillum oryzae]|uniref:Phospholipid/cholesterol/gamma-HCH transport system substrate-binding protein n=1 Tax=Azospirillum oryzae TaxID=286727 RepID=A0A1X7H5T9_9PROT|nr:outer membrane lipid asymmetry maintenance protein MlaD [Azospirillum oryzae]SMF80302.1 phospholipid/cholesterol/gamma-HCH transport system substrate-binding protein [Azospirillum oryzae]